MFWYKYKINILYSFSPCSSMQCYIRLTYLVHIRKVHERNKLSSLSKHSTYCNVGNCRVSENGLSFCFRTKPHLMGLILGQVSDSVP